MKKIFNTLVIMGLILTGCNPLEDINNEIDAQGNPIKGSDEFTMTSDDYADLVDQGEDDPVDFYEMFESFNSIEDAKETLPPFLANKYPFWGEGSSVIVNYNVYNGNPGDDLGAFTQSEVYTLTNDDYALTGSDANGFYPNVSPTELIPMVLSAQITTPEEGQIVLAEYDQYFETPEIGLANVYSAEFPADYDSFELVSVSGPDELGWTVGQSNIQGSGFNGAPNALEEWVISPQIDLTDGTDLLFQITQEIDFLGDSGLIDVMISTDYTEGGDVMDADWTALDFDKSAFGDMTVSEDFDFSDYDGEQIHVGLKYSSTDSDSPRWRVQSFVIKVIGISGDTDAKGEYFVYQNGAWEAYEGVYYLSASDYDSMGEESGQPGRFNNFSGSVAPENYLPAFLNIKFPFAQEEDEILMLYRFFAGGDIGTVTRGNLYTFTDGVWVPSISSLSFGFKDGVWVPDNTIFYTLQTGDYDLVVDQLTGVDGFENQVGNLDSFGNFNRSGSSSSWSDSKMTVAMNIILDAIDPNAEEELCRFDKLILY